VILNSSARKPEPKLAMLRGKLLKGSSQPSLEHSPCRPLSSRLESEPSLLPDRGACINHPAKRGKYYARDDEDELAYCSRCAIKLASQGF
jgi:hypothetical protein